MKIRQERYPVSPSIGRQGQGVLQGAHLVDQDVFVSFFRLQQA
jgi:hypothetical protein